MSPARKTRTTFAPAIRVVDVAAEDAGHTFDAWIPADQSAEDIEAAVSDLMRSSPFGGAGGWAIREYRDFGDAAFNGRESLEDIARLARLLVELGGIANIVLAQTVRDVRRVGEVERMFEETYHGRFESMADWGEWLAEHMDLECSELLSPYIDWDAFGKDTVADGGEYDAITDADGFIHIFSRD